MLGNHKTRLLIQIYVLWMYLEINLFKIYVKITETKHVKKIIVIFSSNNSNACDKFKPSNIK